ncbi:MAG: NAD(P)-dependent oxidoreductase [Chitinophagaceae bacterium]|nr:NAD(P)-dependent oxidoreductase [Chitinophagaceae bacterium]
MSEATTMNQERTAASAGTGANTLFPVFLKLEQLRILVVGGGPVALEKLQALLGNAPTATVRLVAISILDEIRQLQQHYPQLHLQERAFAPADLLETDIAIIAINNKAESQHIRQLARQQQVLVNVADTPDLCDFYLYSKKRTAETGHLHQRAIAHTGQAPERSIE